MDSREYECGRWDIDNGCPVSSVQAKGAVSMGAMSEGWSVIAFLAVVTFGGLAGAIYWRIRNDPCIWPDCRCYSRFDCPHKR